MAGNVQGKSAGAIRPTKPSSEGQRHSSLIKVSLQGTVKESPLEE